MTRKLIQVSSEIISYHTLIDFFIQWIRKGLNCHRIRDIEVKTLVSLQKVHDILA